ncbi:MAG: protein kinase [Lachnospiraceae bacterium]|nr:protein kinase [Lachnospiraceae bacterium]
MIQDRWDKTEAEELLCALEAQGKLFSQFMLKTEDGHPVLLGSSSTSLIYEMANRERPEPHFALKVTGFSGINASSEDFKDSFRVQWMLQQNNPYVCRVRAVKELLVKTGANGEIIEASEHKPGETEDTDGLCLRLLLMEKLEPLLETDRSGQAYLREAAPRGESRVLEYALHIGQALAATHSISWLHRDIKIENTFWDARERVYKLGDFGTAKNTDAGMAETVIYSDGYGAPEIEKRLEDSYGVTADIYSFGVTLYLLLNDLKFPGSDSYFPQTAIQYREDFVFPAPAHASPEMAAVIRRMCSFYAKDRYQSMPEVLSALAAVIGRQENETEEELRTLATLATEAYQEEAQTIQQESYGEGENISRPKTRSERKAEQKAFDECYRQDSFRYYLLITVLLLFLFRSGYFFQDFAPGWMLCLLPVALLFEALLQKIRDFYFFFGTLLLAAVVFLAYGSGPGAVHIVAILVILIGCPVLTAAAGSAMGLWVLLGLWGRLQFLEVLYRLDLAWVFWGAVLLVVNRYFCMRIFWEKTTRLRAILGVEIYDKMFPAMAIAGVVLFLLQKLCGLQVPAVVQQLHLIRTGALGFAGMIIFYFLDEQAEETA